MSEIPRLIKVQCLCLWPVLASFQTFNLSKPVVDADTVEAQQPVLSASEWMMYGSREFIFFATEKSWKEAEVHLFNSISTGVQSKTQCFVQNILKVDRSTFQGLISKAD